MTGLPNTDSHIEHCLRLLKDFQRATVDVVYDRLFAQGRARMLVADEVGLGKTIVAKGVIARRLKDKLAQGDTTPLRVTYICSNQIIGQENAKKLDIYPQQQSFDRNLDRLVFLALKPQYDPTSLLRLNTLTPGTSFRSSEHAGDQRERKIIYSLLMDDEGLLADAPDGLACLLRGAVQRLPKDWAAHLEEERIALKVRDDLPRKFLDYIKRTPLDPKDIVQSHVPGSELTTLYDAVFEYACRLDFQNFESFKYGSLEIIRQLRKALATLCIDYIDADFYILDEFQRFRDLINEESDSEAAKIAKLIFKKPNTKVLLLSATPFKAFTGESDLEGGEEHYKEFGTVLSFLLENDRKVLAEYESHRQALFKQLLSLRADDTELDSTHRDAVEALLRRAMCRTERLSVSEDHDAMTQDKWHDSPVALTQGDVANFVATDNVVRALNLTCERKSQELHAPVEFCKSAPFPLSFLDDYKLKKVLKAKKADPAISACLGANVGAWLDHNRIDNYEMEMSANGSPFANARFTRLVDEALSCKAETLLWVPPSLPYYPLSGAFADADGFSKTLVFSAWLMVPRMLSSLLSYEVERRTIGSAASVEPQEKERGEPRTYFEREGGGRRHPVPQLVYRTEGGADPTPANMTNFALLFPSMTLAAIFEPANALVLKKDRNSLVAEMVQKCRELIDSHNLRQFENAQGNSDRWYWAAPLLLDKLNKEFRPQVASWLRSDSLRETSFWNDEDAKETGKGVHFQRLVRAFDSPTEIGLGPIPDDLPGVLAEIALGSPAVVAFRSFQRLYQSDSQKACVLSLSVANEFINLFNKPEAIAAVRIAVEGREPYWQKTLRYCRDGCLQAVLDECLHLLKADCETVEAAVVRLNDSINLKTTSIKVDDLGTFVRDERKNMRCHFAVDLGNQRIDTEEGSKRVTNIRQNFNSPFRPFVLATTSIGQEGLDFHQYCRKVVHWNLPSNPIDLEQREGRINRFKGLVIRQLIAHKYGALLSKDDLKSGDIWDDLFRIASEKERNGTTKCELVPYWHVETKGFERYRIERIIPFYPFSRDRAKLTTILRTLAIYRLAFGQPRQSELIGHLLKHIPPDRIPEIRKSLLIDLSPISYLPAQEEGSLVP